MRGKTKLVPVQTGDLSGFRHPEFDLEGYWQQIIQKKEEATPCYAMKTWRRVYRLRLSSGDVIYYKEVDETRHEDRSPLPFWASNEAQRYLKHYGVVRGLGVHTARVLFALGKRNIRGWQRSVIGTQELSGFSPFPEFFAARGDDVKRAVLQRLCMLTLKMHANGYYFSLDGHNIMVRDAFAGRAHDIALIDLDHLQRAWLGRLPSRRRKRALKRFSRTVNGTPGLGTDDFSYFEKCYYTADPQPRGAV
ncbi:MAG: lipopolysaccharide kinase InaA family protein [Desulfobacterales bacterium]|nr:lipopolysaccharide kinase InaA family protein [Desulfobacterales bacterium]